MDKVVIHSYTRGSHPAGGKYIHYDVISGPNPFGPRGGLGGNYVDGQHRKYFWDRDKAEEFAKKLAVDECLNFCSSFEVGDEASSASTSGKRKMNVKFSIESIIDDRSKRLLMTLQRKGQNKFRKDLLRLYKTECVITGCGIKEVLDAAHIHPYLGDASNAITNGLLLRSDIHKLFDSFLVTVTPKYRFLVSKSIRNSEYGRLHNKKIKLPSDSELCPSQQALAHHYKVYKKARLY